MPTSVPSATRPAGLCIGVGHVVVYGNPAFHAQFGSRSLGMPARETLIDLPPEAFELLDAVFTRGRPLARWIERDHEAWRMTAVPRRDPGTEEVYGVAFHLRAGTDVPPTETRRREHADLANNANHANHTDHTGDA